MNLLAAFETTASPLQRHAFFELLAYAVSCGLFLFARLDPTVCVPARLRLRLLGTAVLGGATGAKLVAFAQDWLLFVRLLAENPAALMNGKSVAGALLGGTIAVTLTARVLRVGVYVTDSFVTPLALGLSIGRLGCFFAGLDDKTYGNATSLPWGVDFGDGVARHPTQLYEVLWVLLIWRFGRNWKSTTPGLAFQRFIVAYAAYRFLVEFIKPEPREVLGLSAIQCLALFAMVFYRAAVPRKPLTLALLGVSLTACARLTNPATPTQREVIGRAVEGFESGDFRRAEEARRSLTTLGPEGLRALKHLFVNLPKASRRASFLQPRAQVLAAIVEISPGGPEAAESLGVAALEAIAEASSSPLVEEWLLPAARRVEPWILGSYRHGAYGKPWRCAIVALRSPAALDLAKAPAIEDCAGRLRAFVGMATPDAIHEVIRANASYNLVNSGDEVSRALKNAPTETQPIVIRELRALLLKDNVTDSEAELAVSVLVEMGQPGWEAIAAGGRAAARASLQLFATNSTTFVPVLRALGEDASAELSILLKDEQGRETRLASLLGYLRVPDAGPRLLDYARSTQVTDRVAAAQGLAALGDARYLPNLMDLATDSSDRVRNAGARAVASFGTRALPPATTVVDQRGNDRKAFEGRGAGTCALLHMGEVGRTELRRRPLVEETLRCLANDATIDTAAAAVAALPEGEVGRRLFEWSVNPERLQILQAVYPLLSPAEQERAQHWLRDSLGTDFHLVGPAIEALCMGALASDLVNRAGPLSQVIEVLDSLPDEDVIGPVQARLQGERNLAVRAELESVLGSRGDMAAAQRAAAYRPPNPKRGMALWRVTGAIAGVLFVFCFAVYVGADASAARKMRVAGAVYSWVLIGVVFFGDDFGVDWIWSSALATWVIVGLASLPLESRITGIRGNVGSAFMGVCIGLVVAVVTFVAYVLFVVALCATGVIQRHGP